MIQQVFSLNFQVVPRDQAHTPWMDRGFLYGDSVYEVVRTYDRSGPFLLSEHYDRLKRSASRIGLDISFSLETLADHMEVCLSTLNVDNAYVRFMVTGGVDRDFHLGYRDAEPQTMMIATELLDFPAHYYSSGLKIKVASILRNHRRALDPNIKSGNYLNNILAAREAKAENYDDTVLVNLDGNITEASNSNIFIVKNGVVYSPNEESGLLEGISRKFLLALMEKRNWPYRIGALPLGDFLSADEVFVTSTLKEVMPVRQVDDRVIGSGEPGPITQQLMTAFGEERARILRG